MLAAVATIGVWTSSAEAAYSVYKYNLNAGWGGWYRTDTAGGRGYYPSVNTSRANCEASIRQRLAENKKYKTQYEVYIIVYSPTNAPAGPLRMGRGWTWTGYYGSVTFGPHARPGRY
jgi:hypothetical protein